jgi:hypothetical protein
MAIKGSNGEQLKLFMPASEFKAHLDSSSDRHYIPTGIGQPDQRESMDSMWARKDQESREPGSYPIHDVQAVSNPSGGVDFKRVEIGRSKNLQHGAGVYDSIKENGLQQNPLPDLGMKEITTYVDKRTGEKRQGEGHHRVAAAAAVEQETGKTQWIRPNYVPAHLMPQNGVKAVPLTEV